MKPRRCKYCRGNFVPERAQDKDAKFCCANHRKAYWRFGGLPFDKMKEQILREVRKQVRAELAASHVYGGAAPSLDALRATIREEIRGLFAALFGSK